LQQRRLQKVFWSNPETIFYFINEAIIMFDQLDKYKKHGHFIFKPADNLAAVCTAPSKCSGIYLIYALQKGKVTLIYIGISGRKGLNGEILHRKDGLRGRFLTGKQFGALRKHTWPAKMKLENIEALDIHWYVTYGSTNADFPGELEMKFLHQYKDIYGEPPRWNKKITKKQTP